MHIRAHWYGLLIHTVRFHSGSGCVVGSDSKVVQFWRYHQGNALLLLLLVLLLVVAFEDLYNVVELNERINNVIHDDFILFYICFIVVIVVDIVVIMIMIIINFYYYY